MGYDVNNPTPLREGYLNLTPIQPVLTEDQKEDLQIFNLYQDAAENSRHWLRALQKVEA